jgi:hypothetical protein
MVLKSLLMVLLVGICAKAQAQVGAPQVRVAIDGTQGGACPMGSLSASLSPDLASLTILFNDLRTEIPAAIAAPVAEKKLCMIRLKFYFTGQYRIAVTGSDLRGFASIPAQGRTRFTVKHYSPFTIDQKLLNRMSLVKDLPGPFEDVVQLTSNFADTPLWSGCGTQGGKLGMNLMTIALTIESENANPAADLIAAIDSLDLNFNSALKYNLAYKIDKKNCPK